LRRRDARHPAPVRALHTDVEGGDVPKFGGGEDVADRLLADASLGDVDDSGERGRVGRVVDELKIRENVFNSV
jgi:hypothetical protein